LTNIAYYARVMQLGKSRWVGAQIIQLRGGGREGSRVQMPRSACAGRIGKRWLTRR